MMIATTHGMRWLEGWTFPEIDYFRGVPFFLFISGYFLYSNYQKSPALLPFIRRRAQRLLPIIYLATCYSVALIFIQGGFTFFQENSAAISLWLFSQLTIFQKFWPAEINELTIHPSTFAPWFISVILILYLAIPLLYRLEEKWRYIIEFIILLNLTIAILNGFQFSAIDSIKTEIKSSLELDSLWYRFTLNLFATTLSIAKVGWMFGLGILARRYYKVFQGILNRPILLAAFIVIPIILDQAHILPFDFMGMVSLPYFLGYIGLAMIVGFRWRPLPEPPDLSIGIYVWHMAVFKLLIFFEIPSLILGLTLTVLISFLTYVLFSVPIAKLFSAKNKI